MGVAVLIGDITVLDRLKTREMVVRIPEVGVRLRQAQEIIDSVSAVTVDLYTCLTIDDSSFAKLGTVRSILVSTVQLGLYDRYVRKNGKPEIVVGLKGSSALLGIFAGTSELLDLISPLLVTAESVIPDVIQTLTLVSAQTTYDILKLTSEGSQIIDSAASTSDELVATLVEDQGVTRIVNVGPGSSSITTQTVDPIYERLQVCESIDIDPMLTWVGRTA